MHLLPHSKTQKNHCNVNESVSILKNNDGQTFLEFLLLLLIMMGMSFAMLRGFNGGVGSRWVALVKVIAKPATANITLE